MFKVSPAASMAPTIGVKGDGAHHPLRRPHHSQRARTLCRVPQRKAFKALQPHDAAVSHVLSQSARLNRVPDRSFGRLHRPPFPVCAFREEQS